LSIKVAEIPPRAAKLIGLMMESITLNDAVDLSPIFEKGLGA
jgi:hypothetical protein